MTLTSLSHCGLTGLIEDFAFWDIMRKKVYSWFPYVGNRFEHSLFARLFINIWTIDIILEVKFVKIN